MKKFFKYLLRFIAALLILLIVIVALLYVPFVQDFVRGKAVSYVESHYGLDVRIHTFKLKFPLRLELGGIYAGKSANDTLVAIDSLRLDVGLRGIFRKEIAVRDLSLRGVKFNIENDSAGMKLYTRLNRLDLQADRVDLKTKLVAVDDLRLKGGRVKFVAGLEEKKDTVIADTLSPGWVFDIGRMVLNDISYDMNTATMPYLGAGVIAGQLSGGVVSLAQQTIDVDSLLLSGGWCSIETTTDTLKAVKAPETKEDTLSESLPWTIRAGQVRLDNSAFTMLSSEESKMNLVVSNMSMRIDSIYNRGSVVRASLKELKAMQQDGIFVEGMKAGVVLDSTFTAFSGVYIKTVNSVIRLDAFSDTTLSAMMKQVPLTLSLDAKVGLADITPFYKGVPETLKNASMHMKASLALTDNRIHIEQLKAAIAGRFDINVRGDLASWDDVKNMTGDITLLGDMPDVTFLRTWVPEQSLSIPRDLNLSARLKADKGNFNTVLRFCQREGCLSLDANYRLNTEAYDGELNLNHFPLHQFLPKDSLGEVSARLRFTGQGFNWEKAVADIEARVDHFFFRRYDYTDLALQLHLDRTHLQGQLNSADPNVPLALSFQGDSTDRRYRAQLKGRIGKVDLQELHLVTQKLTVGTQLDITALLESEEVYEMKARFDSLGMTDEAHHYQLGDLALNLNSNLKKTHLKLTSGDFGLTFRADTSLMEVVKNVGEVTAVMQNQIERKDVNMEQLQKVLPACELKITGERNNAIARYLQSKRIGFRDLFVDMVVRERSGVRFGARLNAPYIGEIKLDSIQLGMWQTGKSLVYALEAGSSSEAWKGLLNLNLTGRMHGDQFRLELRQKNGAGKIGFDLGINLALLDTAFVVSLFPMNPILGYSRWIVNPDNQIRIGKDGKIKANLRMSYANKLINIQSLQNSGDEKDRLQIEMNGLQLEALSQMMPFMPRLDGGLNTDLMLYSQEGVFSADGNIEVRNLFYENRRVGTVDLDLSYALNNQESSHSVDFELKIDSIRRAVAEGSFSTSATNRDIAVDMDIPSFPLYVVNAFMPEGVLDLRGELYGGVRLRGTIDEPLINGDLAFRNGEADVIMLGTVFRLDTSRIVINSGQMEFQRYRFVAPNGSTLVLNGQVKLTPFDRMGADLTVTTHNFEAVNVKKNTTSLIYGKAYVDVNARIAGSFSSLNMSGNVSLLNNTNITYMLRSSDPELQDKSVDVVRFVSFRDSTLNEKDDLTNRVNASSFAMRLLIAIGDNVNVNVDLSEDGSNNIAIQGGGNLVLVMGPESGMTLSGKYTLTGGDVVYNVPIAGKKEFSIQSGSYVEWTGNVMNPRLNISASEQVKATVEDGDRNRLVTFESIIRIQNTLSQPEITFDLSSPNDMVIQNQLATFSPEERTRQALNLLIYNTYTAPGAAKSGNTNMANNALYSFVENELNKYTRKTGFTFGVDSYNTDENTTRTDYTYQFSRQLFNDRVRVKIGGRISTDNNEAQSGDLQENLVDDISIEYDFTKKRNLFLKVFRHSNYESVLDGEVTQTGIGIVWRKSFQKLKDLFIRKSKKAKRMEENK